MAETVVVAVVKEAVEMAVEAVITEVTLLVIAEAAATSLMLVRPAILGSQNHSDWIGFDPTVHSIQSRSTECGLKSGLHHWFSTQV